MPYIVEPTTFPAALGADRSYTTAWIALQITGSHVLLPILCATFLATRAVRPALLINMCLTWIVTGVISCLLFYAQQYGPEGAKSTICITQAALIYAVTPMTSAAHLCLLYNLWYTMRPIANKQYVARPNLLRDSFLLLLPYIVFIAFAVPGAVIAVTHTENVNLTRHAFYCSVADGPYPTSAASATAVFLTLPVILEAMIIDMLLRNWAMFRRTRNGAGCEAFYVMRVLGLGIYSSMGFALSFYNIFAPGASVVPDMVMSTVPVFFGLLFATSRDVWQAWLRLEDKPQPTASLEDLSVGLDADSSKFEV